MANGDTKTNQYLDIAANGTRADLPTDTCCETRSQTLIRGVAERVMDVEDELEELKNNPDVVDIVATYADLQAYNTQQLTDKDVIRVLQDETHDGDSTYYRYNKQSNTWAYIGESKQYKNFVGTDGTTVGKSGLVPAPATTDAGKFLKADGTWDTAGGQTVVQTPGTSTTSVMSQNAVTSMVFADPETQTKIRIGAGTSASEGSNGVEIGYNAAATKANATALGVSTTAEGYRSTAIGYASFAQSDDSLAVGGAGIRTGSASSIAIGPAAEVKYNKPGAIALGAYSSPSATGEMNIGSSNTYYGYNTSKYRLLTGLYDPQSAHDAATKGYVDPTTDSSAPTTATAGRLGQIQIDTTNSDAYMCVAVDSVTPSYTWKKITP